MIMIRTVYHKIHSLLLHILKFYLIKILFHHTIDHHSSILKFKNKLKVDDIHIERFKLSLLCPVPPFWPSVQEIQTL